MFLQGSYTKLLTIAYVLSSFAIDWMHNAGIHSQDFSWLQFDMISNEDIAWFIPLIGVYWAEQYLSYTYLNISFMAYARTIKAKTRLWI